LGCACGVLRPEVPSAEPAGCCTSEDDGDAVRAWVEGCMALLLPAAAFELLVPAAELLLCVVAGGRGTLCVVAEAEVVCAVWPAALLFPLIALVPLFAVGGRCTANGALLPTELPADLELFAAPALVDEVAPIAGALARAIMVGGGVACVTALRFVADAGGTALFLGCCPPSIEVRVGVRPTLRMVEACIRAELGTACPAWFIARPLAIALPGAAVTAPFTVLLA
jgi:hypothetical protein